MYSVKEPDAGTPARESAQQVTLEIDGVSVTVPAGTSVMRAAAQSGVKVPRLCATDTLEAFGSCRLCLVQIEGRRGYPASCTTPVEAGMKVRTQSDPLARLRRGVMEMYISDHPLDCLTCPTNGNCELQEMAGVVGLREVRYGYDGENHFKEAVKDTSNPYFDFDPGKCIAWSRCVRACEEIQGTFALTLVGRAFASKIAAGPTNFLGSECVSCGACVQACPTATLVENTVIAHGQPDHAVTTTCAYCGVGCTLTLHVQHGVGDDPGDRAEPVLGVRRAREALRHVARVDPGDVGRVGRRHHHRAHAVGAQGVHRQGQHQGRIDAARQPDDGAREAVLADVVAHAEHQRRPRLRLKCGQRMHLPGHAASTRVTSGLSWFSTWYTYSRKI